MPLKILRCVFIGLTALHASAGNDAAVRTLRELADGSHDGERVTVRGVADEFLSDDVDSSYKILRLTDGNDSILVSILTPGKDVWRASDVIDATVTVTGVYRRRLMSSRRFILPRIILDTPSDLSIVTPPAVSPFDRPRLDVSQPMPPEVVATLGRRSVVGQVVAAWQGRYLLLLAQAPDTFVRVELTDNERLPACGAKVLAVGTVETDLFHYKLTRARFKVLAEAEPSVTSKQSRDREMTFPLRDLISMRNGRQAFNATCYGHVLAGTGHLRAVTRAAVDVLSVECNGQLLTLDVSAAPKLQGLPAGTKVSFAGICVLEVPNWRPNLPLPQIEGVTVVLRRADDLTVLARPPWWTVGRLLTIICGLLATLGAILVWNRSLRLLAERRGRELTKETVARVTSEFKAYERTRLAVELHDSIAQNLTGISLAIDTANKMTDADQATLHQQLDLASRSLKSCREELRNCLWDLRSNALEAADFNEAIRQALAPRTGDAALHIRFNIPRERLTDSTTHALIRIIRELTVNAVRHGGATVVWVAGSIEGALLKFSVRDNGCGFDPATIPGAAEGHFGLLGIRERIAAFEGDFNLVSAPGAGTKATVSLRIPLEKIA